jgi:NADH:ubiquinone oxidoreductase subunit 5 (subunit L)/multisubunit Na+/H+ antiporter MnhA subunit
MAAALTLGLLSLMGLPPLAGFLGKFYVFKPGCPARAYLVVVIAVINSVISAYYYLKIIRTVWIDAPQAKQPVKPLRSQAVIDHCQHRHYSVVSLPSFLPKPPNGERTCSALTYVATDYHKAICLIDSHAHLDMEQFDEDRDELSSEP